MAFGVDAHPNPPEPPKGHYEYDLEDGEVVRRWIPAPEYYEPDADAIVDPFI